MTEQQEEEDMRETLCEEARQIKEEHDLLGQVVVIHAASDLTEYPELGFSKERSENPKYSSIKRTIAAGLETVKVEETLDIVSDVVSDKEHLERLKEVMIDE